MSSTPDLRQAAEAALPEITRRDRARFVKEARRLRAAEMDRIFRSIGRGLARLGRNRTLQTRAGTPGAAAH